MSKSPAVQAGNRDMDTERIQQDELEAMRAIFGDDWHDISPSKTAWGAVESGWWVVRLKAHDDRVGISLKGKLLKVSRQALETKYIFETLMNMCRTIP